MPRLPGPIGRAYVGLFLAAFGWAAAFVAAKIAVGHFSPGTAAALRQLTALMVILPFAWRAWPPADLYGALLPLAVFAIAGGACFQWTFMAAVRETSVTNAALLMALNPVLTVALAPLVGESVTRRRLVGLGLALTGAAIVITRGDPAALAAIGSSGRGDALALAAAGFWACVNIASRRVVGRVPNSLANACNYGVGGCVLLLLALPEDPYAQLATAPLWALGALLFMVLCGSIMAGQFFLYGVHRVGVGRTAVFIYMVPVLTALLSALVLGEPLLASQVVGGAAVLLGVYVSSAAGRAAISGRQPEAARRAERPTEA
ncbi:MAG: DMT family transporter [Candidatus Binatia bacterium]